MPVTFLLNGGKRQSSPCLDDYRARRCRHADHSRPWGIARAPVGGASGPLPGLIWFVTDLRSSKEHEIKLDHEIGLVFIDRTENAYLSITASANVLRDHKIAASIWRVADNMWWDGPRDPNVGLLQVIPRTAELWDGPSSKTVTAFEFLKSQIIGAKPNLGENRKTTINMQSDGPESGRGQFNHRSSRLSITSILDTLLASVSEAGVSQACSDCQNTPPGDVLHERNFT